MHGTMLRVSDVCIHDDEPPSIPVLSIVKGPCDGPPHWICIPVWAVKKLSWYWLQCILDDSHSTPAFPSANQIPPALYSGGTFTIHWVTLNYATSTTVWSNGHCILSTWSPVDRTLFMLTCPKMGKIFCSETISLSFFEYSSHLSSALIHAILMKQIPSMNY